MIVRSASIVALIGLSMALAAAPAAAQPYPPVPEITITTPGATIIIEGRSWRPGTQVTIEFNNPSGQTFSATAVADETGAIETDVPIPDHAQPGTLAVAFNGTAADGTPREEHGTVQVVSPDANAANGGGSLNTGGSSTGAGSSDAVGSAGAANASDQVAMGQTGRPANATLPATTSQPPAILLAIGMLGAGIVALGAARARTHRSAQ